MKAKLLFNLSDPEDKRQFILASNAENMAFVLWDIMQIWRKFKHADMSDDYEEGMQAVLNYINECLEELRIDIDEMT